jgi:hypothetical protein
MMISLEGNLRMLDYLMIAAVRESRALQEKFEQTNDDYYNHRMGIINRLMPVIRSFQPAIEETQNFFTYMPVTSGLR